MSEHHHSRIVQIVTDGAAQIGADWAAEQHVIVMPFLLAGPGSNWRVGEDISHERAVDMLLDTRGGQAELRAPTVEEYTATFSAAIDRSQSLISFHASAALSASYANAELAADKFRGQSSIRVIDTLSAATGQTFVVKEATRLLAAHRSLEQIAPVIRKLTQRVYGIFMADDMPTGSLARLRRARGITAKDTGHIPLVGFEDGELVLLEKVRTVDRAFERIAEYAAEFESASEIDIVTGQLQDGQAVSALTALLHDEIPALRLCPVTPAGVLLGSILGRRCVGVMLHDDSAE